MKKSEIEFHSDRCDSHPAINVKVYNSGDYVKVMNHFKCSGDCASKALDFAFQSAQHNFWDQIQDLANFYLPACKVWQEGRSGGWLVVHGLPDVERWDAIMVSRWSNFVKSVKREIAYRCEWDQIRDDIEANEWYKDGSEAYNFVDTEDGHKCIADLKKEACKAGFAAVVRK